MFEPPEGGGRFTGYRHCRRPYVWVEDSRRGGFEAWRLQGLEGLAGHALSQSVKGVLRELRPQTQAPFNSLHEALRLRGLQGLAGQAVSQKVEA